MGKISEKIDEIIAERQKQLPLIQAAREKAMAAEEKMRAFRMFQKEMPTQGTEFEENIASIKTDDFEKSLKEYLDSLDIMEQRLSRRTLNISFIGRAGQGKSAVMQNISGLDKSVIPSSDRGDCTGAKSVITNTESDRVEAEITFFNEIELVDILNKYLAELFQQNISSVRDIPHINIGKIKTFLEESGKKSPKHEEWIDHLAKYVEHYDDYARDLGRKITVPKEDIEKYVAQYSDKNPDVKYYKYLGVRLADIKTRFPHEDSGRIVLVDTIGIGATSLGTEDAMLKTAETDSDAILFMFRPDNKRGRISNNEVDIVRDIEERVSKKYAKEMFFWVVNRVEDFGSNVNQVNDVVRHLETKDYKNAGIFNVNCIDPSAVENDLIVPLLARMSSRIQNADSILIERLNEKGKKAFEEYDKICQQLENIFNGKISRDLEEKLKGKMDSAYKTGILDQLRQLHFEYWDKKDSTCVKLNTELDKKLKNMLFNVLKNDEIKPITYLGGKTADEMYIICTNIMRTRIINDFLSLDLCLDEIVEEMKMQVLHKLVDEDKGRLCFILPLDGMKSGEWIDSFIKKTEAETKYNLFADALKKLKEYRINVTGFLIHDVRMAISSLDTSLKGKNYESDYEIRNSEQDKEKLAEEIRRILEYKTELAHNDLAEKVQNFCVFPNRSMYAAITDFYDRMAFSKNDETKIEDVMERFYRHNIPIIWQQEFLEDDKIRSQKEQWDKITKALKSLDMKSNFIIG